MNAKARAQPESIARQALVLTALIVTAPLWLAAVVVVVLGRLLQVVALYALVWTWWIGKARRRTLFVYSDSPNWKEYLEEKVLPRLPANSVVLNWSHRSHWPPFSLPVVLFRCFSGEREFNPIGLVFNRFGIVKAYRFWQPFRDARHGYPGALERVEAGFLKHAAG